MLRRILPFSSLIIRSQVKCCYSQYCRLNLLSDKNVDICDVKSLMKTQIRTYAKGKDKKKDKGQNKKVTINENEMGEVMDVEKFKQDMHEAVNTLRHDFVHKISLRSTTGGIDTLRFSYKGEKIDLLEVAKVNRSNPEMVIIDLTSQSHLLPTVMKVISTSGMNLNPQQDGSSIIIPIPQITQQYKEGLSKSAKAMFVKCRDLIKDSQNKNLKILKNKIKEGYSEDLIHRVSDQVIFMGNTYISDAEKLLKKKQEELTS